MADADPVISIVELRDAITRLTDAMERKFGPTVHLARDQYWGLFSPEMFAADGSRPEVMGRLLSDDVNSVRELLDRSDTSEDELLLWHDLNHLVGILQRISALALNS